MNRYPFKATAMLPRIGGSPGSPETVEIVLDRALPQNQRTRFILTDASGSQTIDYDFRAIAPIPATGTLGVIIMALAVLVAAAVIIRRPFG